MKLKTGLMKKGIVSIMLFISIALITSCNNGAKETAPNSKSDSIIVNENSSPTIIKQALTGVWGYDTTLEVNLQDKEIYKNFGDHYFKKDSSFNEKIYFDTITFIAPDKFIRATTHIGTEKISRVTTKGTYEIADKGTLILGAEEKSSPDDNKLKIASVSPHSLVFTESFSFGEKKFMIYERYKKVSK